MIVTSTRSCLLRQTRLYTRRKPVAIRPRTFFSSAGPGASQSPAAAADLTTPTFRILAPLIDELDKLAPRFEINPNQIQILREPKDFYATLKDRILKAKRRIFLSTLYVGKSEQELISTLQTALRFQPNLKLSILTDALRGTRESPETSCASLLAPLVTEFGEDRVELRMYHTPNLTGLKKALLPKRINEGSGLQHMKLYGFDDEIILSGANLSDDYFTNRQDRYHVLSSGELTEYYASVHRAVCGISFKVQPRVDFQAGFELVWPITNPCPSPLEDVKGFKAAATKVIAPLLRPFKAAAAVEVGRSKTFVYPLGQFTPVLYPDNTSTEYEGLTSLLGMLDRNDFTASKWTFTAGYFNMHPSYKRLLLDSKSQLGTVITAAPEANGFYGSAGISGWLPPAYLVLARRFLQDVVKSKRAENVELLEWRKGTVNVTDGWTYHAKGIWITLPSLMNPSITFVGSSNYTRRSHTLDLEMNALVVTDDEGLRMRLAEEIEWLKIQTKPLKLEDFKEREKSIKWYVKVALWFVGGAL